ncbi:TetR/AcrR family transcriptional regulator [Microbacterium azadirachtae]|uniref:Tetracycline repressor protein class B from transposon Tn10 n=1 Tax=Microbacterium azadirachtae TaxID=582680 RepID=A0A0F0KEP5_9MICO|nr:TetR/AcrR family transcriptional regulator [Microbacterium azadirachtae]KJL19382.1 Tetracycline repressor protein class B from transposon Tn10 [Microbacterium azadirachtae]SDL45362.1 regulatory protein, tetR family [Microbacterium azadirachtae]SEF75623.1 regulatory protein, tetR family [Microbacterium azadirachtae]SEF76455.1 regulatory protein, tetR family [Microbacterium azadirachtae]
MPPRTPLSRERIVAAATQVADEGGLGAVSMRSVGRALGAEAMSLYHHVSGKEELLDLLADAAFAQIPLLELGTPWRAAMTSRAHAMRAVLKRHPWALSLLESRSHPGEAVMRHHDRVLGLLRSDGFELVLAAHAYSVLDAYIYGFVLTELSLPFTPETGPDAFAEGLELPAADYPHLAEMLEQMVVGHDYAFGDEFDYGLDLVLDQLEVRRAAQGGRRRDQ